MIAVLISDELRAQLMSPETEKELADLGAVQSTLAGARICVTGWDTTPLNDSALDSAPDLALIAHTGGSVRALVPESAYERGIRVTHASAVLAEAVAEFAVLKILAGLRDVVDIAVRMRSGMAWESATPDALRSPSRLLRDATVGVVGASNTGRATLHRLRPFGCDLLVYDPYLEPAAAADLGAHSVDLTTLLDRADVVSLHAPLLSETRGMIGAAELGRMRDGAIFVNTARAGLVDEPALLAEVRTGRIRAMLDVFHDEPLPANSPWRHTDGVVATPHVAALTKETLLEQGSAMAAEIGRFLARRPLHHEITKEAYQHIA
jgi:phosphoglycerate dehydrogenase-like enzyme